MDVLKRGLYIHSSLGIGETTATKHDVNGVEGTYGAEVIYKN